MNFRDTMRAKGTWRFVLAIKLAALALLWISIDRGFRIGDLPASAEEKKHDDDKKTPEKSDTTKGDQKKSEEKPGDGAAATDKKSDATAKEDEKAGTPKTRKSFLANLLELPELDSAAPQKEEVGKYLEIAERKKQQVEERLAMLGNREKQLRTLEGSIDEKLSRLDEERRYFAQTIQQEKDLKGDRLEKLVAMYAKMEPKKAAPIMEKLDKDLVIELFKRLPQKQVTSLLEGMSAENSVRISEYYGRVRSTREYDVLKEMNQSLRKEFDECKGMPAEPTPPPAAAPAE